jgi:8-oxo-dGTP pyrophosphatase MutT (NUDIX family)
MSQESSAIAPARSSATVVIAREGERGPELLMVRRRAGDVFGDSYAFPGGLVDDDEGLAHAFCQNLSALDADTLLGVQEGGGLDYFVAAIRELFEETGILLARNERGEWADSESVLQEHRVQVDRRELPWSEFMRRQGLRMACDALHYFAHWETPLHRPKRWSTRFFLAEMPAGQSASHDGSELTDSRWLSAAEALSFGQQDGIQLPFPTVRNLESLSAFASVDDLLDWARAKAPEHVHKIRPVRIRENGESKYVIPGDSGYPDGGDG